VGSRPWFTRVWTIQEAAASNFVVLFCGKERLLIGTFFTWYRIALAGVLESYANIPVVLEQLPRNTLHFRIRIGLRGRLSFADFVPDGFDGQFNVTEMMCDVQKCGAFEPKDKIFALHTVLRRAGIVLPPADYKKSLDEIYYTATLAILKAIPPNRGGLDFLHQVTGRENTRLDPAPSWVPDYSEAIPPWPVVDGTSSVTKYMKPDYRFSHNDLHLCSPAIVIDRVEISSTQTTWHPDRILVAKDDLTWETLEADPGKTIRALQNWIRIASAMPDSYHPTAQTKQEAFFATIGAQRGSLDIHQQVNRIRSSRDPTTRDIQHLSTALSQILGGDSTAEIIKNLYTHSFAGDAKTWWSILMANDPSVAGFSIPSLSTILSYPPPTSLIARTFWDNFDLAILNKSAEWKILLALSTVLPGLCESILTVCRGNTFFRTKAGYMGAGPKSIRNGDLIVFIAGISCPMAVRPTGKGYNLVAPMYVHGIMKGEIWEDVEEIYRLKRAREFGRGGEVERYYLDLTLV
jgi:hypothetical protein